MRLPRWLTGTLGILITIFLAGPKPGVSEKSRAGTQLPTSTTRPPKLGVGGTGVGPYGKESPEAPPPGGLPGTPCSKDWAGWTGAGSGYHAYLSTELKPQPSEQTRLRCACAGGTQGACGSGTAGASALGPWAGPAGGCPAPSCRTPAGPGSRPARRGPGAPCSARGCRCGPRSP